MHCFSFLIWGDPKGDFVMRVAHQQTEARNDPSVVGKAEIRGLFLIAQPPSHDAQNRLNSGILRHNLNLFRGSVLQTSTRWCHGACACVCVCSFLWGCGSEL